IYTYTITVHNSGPSDAQNASISVSSSLDFSHVLFPYPFGTVTPGTGGNFTATLGTINAGASKSITVTFTVPASTPPGPQTDTVEIGRASCRERVKNKTVTVTEIEKTSEDMSITKSDWW